MSEHSTLFADEPKYCIDTNVVVSFLRGTDDEHYGADIFAPQWALVERRMGEGKIIAPRQVEAELEKWETSISQMKTWLHNHRYLFRDVESDAQLEAAKLIVNTYPVYGKTMNYLGDLEVITLALAQRLTVLSLESGNQQPSKRRPKIPDVCREFGVDCVSIPGFLRREGFGRSA